MRLACVALLLLAAPVAGQQQEQTARRLMLDASRALQAGNAARFLGYFDEDSTPGFAQLREDVLALVESKAVASSVQIDKTTVEGEIATMTVDWLLQLTPARDLGAVEQRREVVEVRVRLGEKAKIVSIAPVEIFRPASFGAAGASLR